MHIPNHMRAKKTAGKTFLASQQIFEAGREERRRRGSRHAQAGAISKNSGHPLRDEAGKPHVYVLTEAASHYYQVMTCQERMPVLIGERI
jgi:hypothetical protein